MLPAAFRAALPNDPIPVSHEALRPVWEEHRSPRRAAVRDPPALTSHPYPSWCRREVGMWSVECSGSSPQGIWFIPSPAGISQSLSAEQLKPARQQPLAEAFLKAGSAAWTSKRENSKPSRLYGVHKACPCLLPCFPTASNKSE